MEGAEVRTYIPEKKQAGKRHWIGKKDQQQAVYANRLRVSRTYGKSLLRKRGELIERSFAHCYDTGAIRNTSRAERIVGCGAVHQLYHA
jgi:transposase